MAKRTAHALQSAFKKWDEDGNGTISRQELGSILSKLGNFKPTDIETVLKEADTNKDGVIDYEEFIQWLAAPAAPLGAAALMSESSACLRAEAAAPDIPPTTVASADCPASWDFGDCGYSKPVPFTEAVELAVQHTIAVWMRLEALKGNPFMTIVSDPMWGLQIGLSDEGGFTVNDPRRKGFVSPEVPAPEGILNKWVLFIVCGSCSTPSPSMEGETEFFVGVDVHGVRSLGSVPVCGSGLVLRDFGCKGQGLASIASVAVWQRRLKDEEIKEIFLWDAVKLGTLSAKEASWLKLNRRIAPDRNEEEEDLFAERLALAAEGKAPGGTLNVAGLKISDKDLPRILDHVERAYDSVSALVLSNNYITEDGVKSHLVPFLSALTMPIRLSLADNSDICAECGEILLSALPAELAWSVDVSGTHISEEHKRRLMNDTPEAADAAREIAMERRRTAQMVEDYEHKQAELERKWAQECDKAVASDDELSSPVESAEGEKSKLFPKFPEGKPDQLRTVRDHLAAVARKNFDRGSGPNFSWGGAGVRNKGKPLPPSECGTGQLLAHFSYLGYQMDIRPPEDFGLRLRRKGEDWQGHGAYKASAMGIHQAVETGKAEVVSVTGKSFGRGAITLQLKNKHKEALCVVVPAGTIFQHVAWVHHQNLLVGRDVQFSLEASETQTKKIGAYCMNLTCGCSANDKMHLTALLPAKPSLLKSQGKVWDHFEQIFASMRQEAGFSEKGKKKKKG